MLMSMRSVHVAAMIGMAISVPFIVPSAAQADTGITGYVQCLGGDAKPPPPGVDADVWFPSVHVITTDFDAGVPAAQITQRLVDMGVSPTDAATRVRCFVANQPRGAGH
jgi:hypothetical protein